MTPTNKETVFPQCAVGEGLAPIDVNLRHIQAFLREEGGTRSVTEGACETFKFKQNPLLRALPQSPMETAPSQREPSIIRAVS